MLIKQDYNLYKLSQAAGKNMADMSYIVANAMVNAGLIREDEEYFGIDVANIGAEDKALSDILKQSGVTQYDNPIIKALFAKCIILGNGNCTECGGDMELWDIEGRTVAYDRDTPPDFICECEVWRCPICGHIENVYK